MFKIYGLKVGMSSISQRYKVVPVTILDITSNVVALKKELPDVGKVLIVGFGRKRKPTKAEVGEYKALGYVPLKLVQFAVFDDIYDQFKVGDQINLDFIKQLVEQNSGVDVTGISKGKGFAGVIKRWGFARQPKTHGQSDRERHPGAIGAQTPGRVLKGKKMAGRMGNRQVTVKNLQVIDALDRDGSLFLLVKGSVPGAVKRPVLVTFKSNINN